MIRSSVFIRTGIVSSLAWFAAAFAQSTKADSLTIAYTVKQNQTAVVGAGFTVVDFTGSVTNNSDAAITFQLTGVLHNFEPYVASFVDGIPFPGITLGPGASSGVIDLAIVTLQPFDPSLPCPAAMSELLWKPSIQCRVLFSPKTMPPSMRLQPRRSHPRSCFCSLPSQDCCLPA
jgi:hypothetical protein